MLQMLLELFTTPQKAEAMLESPIIELIFMALFGLFILVIITHSIIFLKIKATRDYVKRTKRMDIEPLQSIKLEFEARQQNEAIKLDTFIQEKFSNWRILQVPVVNLIKLVQMTISVFILLGVLGTFIGLTISLGNISTAGDQLVENVAAVLSGIDVAFYTSIIGMGFSLVMTLLIRLFNAEYLLTDLMLIVESQLESRKQHGLNRMIAVSEMIHDSIQSLEETNKSSLGSIVEAFAGFKNYTEGLQQSAEDLATFNDGLSKNLEDFDELFRQMSLVTDGFSEGTNQLNENFSSLFTYFEHVDRNNERMANSITRTAEKVEDVSDAQIKSLQGFDQSVTELKTFTAASLKGQEESLRSLEKINRQTGNLADTIGTQTTVMQNIFGDDLSIRLSNISTYLADLKKGFDLASNSIVALPGALEVISQTQKDHYHLLGDRFRELERFNEIFGEHLRNYGADAATLENHLREAAATFKMLSEKNNHTINEIYRSLSDTNTMFSQRDHQLASTVTALNDSVSNHVKTTENTLAQRLDTMIRSIDNSLYSMGDNMNRELGEMRRVSEEITQNHSRLTQQLLQELGREIQLLNRKFATSGRQETLPPQRIDP